MSFDRRRPLIGRRGLLRTDLGVTPGRHSNFLMPTLVCSTRSCELYTALTRGYKMQVYHIPTAKFPLGDIVATPGALEALREANQNPAEFLARHACGDWGDLSADDVAANQSSLEHNCRLLSSYGTATGSKLWIITEADRSATTLLLPEEY